MTEVKTKSENEGESRPLQQRLAEWRDLACTLRTQAVIEALDSDVRSLEGPGELAERGDKAVVLQHPVNALALLHFDHPITLSILDSVEHDPAIGAALREAMSDAKPLGGLAMPVWRPETEAVRRHLGGDPKSKALAAMYAGRRHLTEVAPDLLAALSVEARPDIRLIYNAALLALGDSSRRAEVWPRVPALLESATEWHDLQ